jgi:hypothetical protein
VLDDITADKPGAPYHQAFPLLCIGSSVHWSTAPREISNRCAAARSGNNIR